MPKVEGTYQHRKATYQIKGPVEWEHPTMRRKFLVYERINPGKAELSGSYLPLTRIKTVLVGFMTGDPVGMEDYPPAVLNFHSACGKKARQGDLSIKYGSLRKQSE